MQHPSYTHTHGMTDTAYKMSLKGESKPSGPWSVSDRDNMTYLFSAAKHEEEMQDNPDCIIEQARQAGLLQCPIFEDEIVHVLLLNIPEDHEVEDDNSCENMASCADCIPSEDLKQFIVGVKSYRLSKYFHPFILAFVMQMHYFSSGNYPDAVIQCAEALKDAKWDYEMIQDNIQEIETD